MKGAASSTTAESEVGTFFIPATTSLQEQQPRTLKHGDTFVVFNSIGDIHPGDGAAEGLYHRDTRHLSYLDLLLAGTRPMLLSSTLRDDNAALTCDLTNADLYTGEAIGLEHDRIHVRRSKFLWQASCFERIAVRNFDVVEHALALEIRFGADFADLFEVRGQSRPRRGQVHLPTLDAQGVTLSYTGLDGQRRTTRVRFDPQPDVIMQDRAVFELCLAPHDRAVLYVEFRCESAARPDLCLREEFYASVRDARRALRASTMRAAAITTSNDIYNECVRRSVCDLYMLLTDTAEGPYPYAGIPWYSAAFGRDALITALLTLWLDPAIARGVLGFLARHQSGVLDPAADAEPGKILHEMRQGEMARLGEVPFAKYYGSVDATPLFIMLAGEYLDRTGDLGTIQRLWPNIEAALQWIDRYGDRDGDGLIEYFRMTESGLANQGWKDSHDSVFHADRTPAHGPIALAEVQGYVFRARHAAAGMAERLGLDETAARLRAQAEELRDRVERSFWCEEIGTYALALDGQKQPCRVRSSNAGHLLLAGLAKPDRAARVAEQLLGPAFFSGWGIRTIAAGEARYNPMSYHNGSVWPHDNALIGLGLGRYGLRHAAARLLEGLFEASVYIELRRLPELICGFPRRRGQGPTFYPVACAPQAWAAAAPLSLLQASLGISFCPQSRTVAFDHPVMPAFTEEIVLRGLSVGDAHIDVVARGKGEAVAVTALARTGEIRVTVTT